MCCPVCGTKDLITVIVENLSRKEPESEAEKRCLNKNCVVMFFVIGSCLPLCRELIDMNCSHLQLLVPTQMKAEVNSR